MNGQRHNEMHKKSSNTLWFTVYSTLKTRIQIKWYKVPTNTKYAKITFGVKASVVGVVFFWSDNIGEGIISLIPGCDFWSFSIKRASFEGDSCLFFLQLISWSNFFLLYECSWSIWNNSETQSILNTTIYEIKKNPPGECRILWITLFFMIDIYLAIWVPLELNAHCIIS